MKRKVCTGQSNVSEDGFREFTRANVMELFTVFRLRNWQFGIGFSTHCTGSMKGFGNETMEAVLFM